MFNSRIVCFLSLLLLKQAFAWFPEELPEYCSKNMSSRAIPALTASQQSSYTLKQVQTFVRHGARTPYSYFFCWEDYEVPWNCKMTQLTTPTRTNTSDPYPYLIRKIYDGSDNYWGGTCLTGQLLTEGFDQERDNGLHVFDAYLSPSLPSTLRLSFDETSFYFRTDDVQRVVDSASVVLNALLNASQVPSAIIDLHLGDYDLDQIYPNSIVCPLLDEINDNAYDSYGYQSYNNSDNIQNMTNALYDILGTSFSYNYVFDCVMTAVCTGHDLPVGMNQGLFDGIVNYTEWDYWYVADHWNESQFSKYAMGQLIFDMTANMESVMNNDASSNQYNLVLYGGHDTSLMPLLAALGVWPDKQWPPYASMLNIELYQSIININDWFFRLVYNGQVLVMDGCSDDVCDIDVWMARTSFARQDMNCAVPADNDNNNDDDDDDEGLSKKGWVGIVIGCSLLSVVLGGFGMYKYEKYQDKKKYVRDGEYSMPPTTPETPLIRH